MSENTMPEQDEVALNAQPPAAEGEPLIEGPPLPDALKDMDPVRLAAIRAKLNNFLAKRGTTISGSEDPDSKPADDDRIVQGGTEGDKPVGETMTGADVDWSEYDLQYDVAHLYKRAVFRDTPQGPKWVATLDEFYSTERDFRNHGKQVNQPGYTDKDNMKEPLNLGEYLSQMVNSNDGWGIAAILPGGMGKAGVILRKQTNVVLPDPTPLKKFEEVEAPKDPELQGIEDAALDFAAEEGLTPAPAVEENGVEETEREKADAADEADREQAAEEAALAARFRSRSEVGLEPGEVLEPRTTELVQRAIDLNRQNPDAAPADAAKGDQPPPVMPDGVFDGAAGVDNVRQGLRKLLDGPDFGTLDSSSRQ